MYRYDNPQTPRAKLAACSSVLISTRKEGGSGSGAFGAAVPSASAAPLFSDGADALVAIEHAKCGLRRYRYDASDRLVTENRQQPDRALPRHGYIGFRR